MFWCFSSETGPRRLHGRLWRGQKITTRRYTGKPSRVLVQEEMKNISAWNRVTWQGRFQLEMKRQLLQLFARRELQYIVVGVSLHYLLSAASSSKVGQTCCVKSNCKFGRRMLLPLVFWILLLSVVHIYTLPQWVACQSIKTYQKSCKTYPSSSSSSSGGTGTSTSSRHYYY